MTNLLDQTRQQRSKVFDFQQALTLATAEVPAGMAIAVQTEPLEFLQTALSTCYSESEQEHILTTAQQALTTSQTELDRLETELAAAQAIANKAAQKLPPLKTAVLNSFEALLADMRSLAAATNEANLACRPLQNSDASPKFQVPNVSPIGGEAALIQTLNALVGFDFVQSQRAINK